jgi:hypothetical protein
MRWWIAATQTIPTRCSPYDIVLLVRQHEYARALERLARQQPAEPMAAIGPAPAGMMVIGMPRRRLLERATRRRGLQPALGAAIKDLQKIARPHARLQCRPRRL